MTKGEVLLVVPSEADERQVPAQLMIDNGGHAMYYFSGTSAESLSEP